MKELAETSVTSSQKIGILGGSFDPIHIGHLLLAEQAREQLCLDHLIFIPAAISPLKQDSAPRANVKQRLEMLQLAIAGNPYFSADARELERGGVSYTVETLRDLRRENPESTLYFLMGADSLASFDRWHQPATICELAKVFVLDRGGHAAPNLSALQKFLPPEQKGELTDRILQMPELEISSSNLRQCFAKGKSTRYQLHPAVEAYIKAEKLYGANGLS